MMFKPVTIKSPVLRGVHHNLMTFGRQKFVAIGLLVLVVAVGIAFKNPAVALLGAMFVRLAVGTNPIASSSGWGKNCLQIAIVLLGFTLGFDRMVEVSGQYGLATIAYVIMTLVLGGLLAWLIQTNRNEATLLSCGTAICGGTAIATLSPLIQAKPHEFGVTMALVFILNMVAIFTFPFIGQWLELSEATFGAWVALAVHDTSSVIATAAIYGDEAVQVATTVKLGRTLWLIPIAFIASIVYRHEEAKLRPPTFVLLFIGATIVGSIVNLSADVLAVISWSSKALLVLALAFIGIEIDRQTLANLSIRCVGFGVVLWVCVAPLALFLVMWAN